MKICVDLDGVICEIRKPGQEYRDVEPIPGAVEKINQLKAAGHYIIIYTARHWKTCEGNVGKILARQGLVTLEWLNRHHILYDEIHFTKPHADVYIDDNAVRFEHWDKIQGDGSTLPKSSESKLKGNPS